MYFFKNYDTLTQKRRTKYRLRSERRGKERLVRQEKKQKVIESDIENVEIEEEAIAPKVAQQEEMINNNTIQQNQVSEINPQDKSKNDHQEIIESSPVGDQTADENILKSTPSQERRMKDQKKITEIRTSILSFKERWKKEEYEKKLIEWLAMDPDNKEFQNRLSEYYFENQQYVKALSLLKKIVNDTPEHHKAIRQIWQIYIHQWDLDTARILIEKAISVKDDNPKYYITLVDILYAKDDLPEAIKAMEKVLKLRPKNVKYLLSIATLHEEIAEPSKALHYYGKIIELDPINDLAKQWIQRLT